MRQYPDAGFSLKTGPDKGLTAEQADAVGRWRKVLTGIAIEEMLHLALVANVMSAIGAAPSLTRSSSRSPAWPRLAGVVLHFGEPKRFKHPGSTRPAVPARAAARRAARPAAGPPGPHEPDLMPGYVRYRDHGPRA